jgi:hypothetical protein
VAQIVLKEFIGPAFKMIGQSSIVEIRPDSFFVAWAGLAASELDLEKAGIWGAFTTPFGWSAPKVIVQGEGPFIEPVLFRMPSGEILLFYKRSLPQADSESYLLRSQDRDGKKWSAPERIPLSPRKKPVLFRNGTIICCQEELALGTCCVYKSSDGGKSWRGVANLSLTEGVTGFADPAFFSDSPDVLSLLCRTTDSPDKEDKIRRVYRATSVDGGESWLRPLPTTIPNPHSDLDSQGLPDGQVVCVCCPQARGEDELSLLLSGDQGRTWSKVCEVGKRITDFDGFVNPSVIISQSRLVHITYTRIDQMWAQWIAHVVVRIAQGCLPAIPISPEFPGALCNIDGLEKKLATRGDLEEIWNDVHRRVGFHKRLDNTVNRDIDEKVSLAALPLVLPQKVALGSLVSIPGHRPYILVGCPTTLEDLGVYFQDIISTGCTLMISLHQPHEVKNVGAFWKKEVLAKVSLRDGWSLEVDEAKMGVIQESACVPDAILDCSLQEKEALAANSVMPLHPFYPRIVRREIIAKKGQEVRTIIHLHFENWCDGTPCPNESLLFALLNLKDELKISPDAPLAINCKAGVGRTGVVVLFDMVRTEVLQQKRSGKRKKEIFLDIPQSLYKLRRSQEKRIVPFFFHFREVVCHVCNFIKALPDKE